MAKLEQVSAKRHDQLIGSLFETISLSNGLAFQGS